MTPDAPNAVLPPAPAPAYPPYLGEAPRRSAIPKVVGILAIVFASLGLIGSLAVTVSVTDKIDLLRLLRDESLGLRSFDTWLKLYLAPAALVFGVHLTAGILSVRYAATAPRWMTLYAVLALALLAADIAISMATFPHAAGLESDYMREKLYEEFVHPRFGLAVLGLPWPIIALVLMNVRSARAACGARHV